MAHKNGSNYDMSKDYQLPTGELWWLVLITSEPKGEYVIYYPSMLFTWDNVKTWYQAQQRAEILIREDYQEYIKQNGKLPSFKVMLWDKTEQNSVVLS